MEGASHGVVRLIACFAVWLAAVPPAIAKPQVGLIVKFAADDKSQALAYAKTLYTRISDDLARANIENTPEEFLVHQFVQAFSVLAMFDFHAARPGDALTLEITLSSKRKPVWPGSDAFLTIRSQRGATLTGIAFAQRGLCGHLHCYPDSGLGFADSEMYQELVNNVIDQWRPELTDIFASVVIDPTTNYREGYVTTERPIAELGEIRGRLPHALFLVFVASQLRVVAFCAQEGAQTVGWDQGDRAIPRCQLDASVQKLPTGLGPLTLSRAFR